MFTRLRPCLEQQSLSRCGRLALSLPWRMWQGLSAALQRVWQRCISIGTCRSQVAGLPADGGQMSEGILQRCIKKTDPAADHVVIASRGGVYVNILNSV